MVLLQELAPGAVAELGRLRGRADDVGEEDGREHPLRLGFIPAVRLPDIRRRSAGSRSAISRSNSRSARWPARGSRRRERSVCAKPCTAATSGGDDRVLGSVQDQRRHAHGWKDVRARRSPGSSGGAPRPRRGWRRSGGSRANARRSSLVELAELAHGLSASLARPEDAQVALDLAPELLLGAAPRVVGRPHPSAGMRCAATSAAIRSGYVAAKRMLIAAPSERP